jgi:hypothetical protein
VKEIKPIKVKLWDRINWGYVGEIILIYVIAFVIVAIIMTINKVVK